MSDQLLEMATRISCWVAITADQISIYILHSEKEPLLRVSVCACMWMHVCVCVCVCVCVRARVRKSMCVFKEVVTQMGLKQYWRD